MAKSSLLLFALSFFGYQSIAQGLQVMTFNIRFNNPGDSANAWPFRKDHAASQIVFHKIDVLGVQEALVGQLEDLKKSLKTFNYVGVGRDKGDDKGEYSAILYNSSVLTVLDQATFWLSETPEVAGSKGWDAAFPRIVTWAKFKHKTSKKVFYLFNTHFDHMGKIARRSSAALLLKKIDSIAGSNSVIVTGDFNAEPWDEPIKIITDTNNKLRLTDTKFLSEQPHYGPGGSFNGFGSKETSEQPIDYIFVKSGFKIKQHANLSQTWGGRFSSDHFPVMAVVEFSPNK